MEPASFCTIATQSCKEELWGSVMSLSIQHQNANMVIMCDTECKKYIESSTPQPKLNITWYATLDKYSKLNRPIMEKMGIWDEFQMKKAEVIDKALNQYDNTLFLDCDTVILDKLYIKDPSKKLGVSPQFITEQHVKRTGYYNGGMLWVADKNIPADWIEFTKTSRYYDQASIEDLANKYEHFEFGENYNLQTWRFIYGTESTQTIFKNLNIKNNKIYYKDEPLKFIHTHYKNNTISQFNAINNHFIELLSKAGCYKQLLVIFRMCSDSWNIYIPKQPRTGIYSHKNDSFRELAKLSANKVNDLKCVPFDCDHCWLNRCVLLYDRPTLSWLNNSKEALNSRLTLFGNGDLESDFSIAKKVFKNCKPWIFWPRYPQKIEEFLDNNPPKNYNEREIESIFIGNYENNVQKTYRNNTNWDEIIEVFHCTSGSNHKFNQDEYIEKLANSKYGLCLRGYGSKCHREVELMALGTVPIITQEVSINAYADPPQENIHYLKVESSDELINKINSISKSKWEEMSANCILWYHKNIHSINMWNSMINYILYDLE